MLKTPLGGLLALAFFAAPIAAEAQTVNTNSTAYPLSSNVMFPSRPTRVSLECFNATTNATATVTYDGISLVLQAGGYLLREAGPASTGRMPVGVITSTGTAAQTLSCVERYL